MREVWRYNAARGGGWMGWERPPPCRDGWSGRPKNHTDFRPAIMTRWEASLSAISAQPISLGFLHVLCGTRHFVSVMRDGTVVSSVSSPFPPPEIEIYHVNITALQRFLM